MVPGDTFTAIRKDPYFKEYIACVCQKLSSFGAEIPHSLRWTPSGPGSSLELRFPIFSVNSSPEVSPILKNLLRTKVSLGWNFLGMKISTTNIFSLVYLLQAIRFFSVLSSVFKLLFPTDSSRSMETSAIHLRHACINTPCLVAVTISLPFMQLRKKIFPYAFRS